MYTPEPNFNSDSASPLRTLLYGIFRNFDELGLTPGMMAATLAVYIGDTTEVSEGALSSLEEAAAWVIKEEEIEKRGAR